MSDDSDNGSGSRGAEGFTISERRLIVFSREAVLDALLYNDRASQGWLCRAAIQRVALRQADAGPVAVVTAERDGQRRWVEVDFNATQIAAALIRYCRALRIPLPRAARKSLELQGDGLCLRIATTVTTPPLHSRI